MDLLCWISKPHAILLKINGMVKLRFQYEKSYTHCHTSNIMDVTCSLCKGAGNRTNECIDIVTMIICL